MTGKDKIDDLVAETDIIKENRRIKQLEADLKENVMERNFLKKAKRLPTANHYRMKT